MDIWKTCIENTYADISTGILAEYRLSAGQYVLVDKTGNYQIYRVAEDKKSKDEEDDDKDCTSSQVPDVDVWNRLKYYSFYGEYVCCNKAVCKRLLSNNGFSMMIAQKTIFNNEICDSNGFCLSKWKDLIVEPYYKKLKDYSEIDFDFCKTWLLTVFPNICQFDDQLVDETKIVLSDNSKNNKKDNICVFFELQDSREENMQIYYQDAMSYLRSKVFLDTKQVIQEGDTVYGIPSSNMSLDGKKPYFSKHLTRKPLEKYAELPCIESLDDVFDKYLFFKWLRTLCAKGKSRVYFSTNTGEVFGCKTNEYPDKPFIGIILSIKQGLDSVEILDYKVITCYQPVLFKKFVCEESVVIPVLTKKKTKRIFDKDAFYKKYYKKQDFFTFIEKNVYKNYCKDAQQHELMNEHLSNFLYYEEEHPFVKEINSFLTDIITKLLEKDDTYATIFEAAKLFNIQLSLRSYFSKGEKNMDYELLQQSVKEKVCRANNEPFDSCESDAEYGFLTGQLIRYFLFLSSMSNKNHAFVKKYVDCRTDAVLKRNVNKLFNNYGFSISEKHARFNHAYQMFLTYMPTQLDAESLLVGYMSPNVIIRDPDKKPEADTTKQNITSILPSL